MFTTDISDRGLVNEFHTVTASQPSHNTWAVSFTMLQYMPVVRYMMLPDNYWETTPPMLMHIKTNPACVVPCKSHISHDLSCKSHGKEQISTAKQNFEKRNAVFHIGPVKCFDAVLVASNVILIISKRWVLQPHVSGSGWYSICPPSWTKSYS